MKVVEGTTHSNFVCFWVEHVLELQNQLNGYNEISGLVFKSCSQIRAINPFMKDKQDYQLVTNT